MSGALCDGFKIGFCIFSIKDTLNCLGFKVERLIVLWYRKYIVYCGIYIPPRDDSIVTVNGHISAIGVNANGSD